MLMRLILLILIILPLSLYAEDEEKLRSFYKNIRCLTCKAQSIYDSDSEFSIKMREFIESEYKKGKKIEEIEAKLMEEWGEEIFFNAKGRNILYLPPIIIILMGILFLSWRLKR